MAAWIAAAAASRRAPPGREPNESRSRTIRSLDAGRRLRAAVEFLPVEFFARRPTDITAHPPRTERNLKGLRAKNVASPNEKVDLAKKAGPEIDKVAPNEAPRKLRLALKAIGDCDSMGQRIQRFGNPNFCGAGILRNLTETQPHMHPMANLLTRRHVLSDREVCEPTLLAFALVISGLAVLAGLCILLIIFLPVFGYLVWAFSAICILLAWLVMRLFRKRPTEATTDRLRWFQRIFRLAQILFIGILACWLGLIAWMVFGPSGPDPPPKEDLAMIRVVTWNIHCGQEEGWPWKQFDWPARKHALQAALDQVQPDILCVQEATPEQVAFLDKTLPAHRRVGGGRDDGKAQGEHCAICFHRQRFDELAGDTFWLEEPIDQPRPGSELDIKRICTWVRLRDRDTGQTLRVYNTHMYLTDGPNLTAAKIILEQVASGDPADAILLTADFNAAPSAPSRQLFLEAKTGLTNSAERIGKSAGLPTFQLYGIGVSSIDGILVGARWRVEKHLILAVKPQNTYPSDHFAVMVDLALPK
jgi:endonuclease/exonuclease/phosphatase family metal-dependent hydrolase